MCKHIILGNNIKKLFISSLLTLGLLHSGEFHEDASVTITAMIEKEPAKSFTKEFYSQLYFIPVWVHENGLSTFSKELLNQVLADKTLADNAFVKTRAISLLETGMSPSFDSLSVDDKLKVEFAMTGLYKEYVSHLLNGNINWSAFRGKLVNPKDESDINGGWLTYGGKENALTIMNDAVTNGSVTTALKNATPKAFKYQALEKKLVEYLAIKKQGGWGAINSSSSASVVRKRLSMTGELGICSINGASFDGCLQGAISSFQKNNGMSATGSMNANTSKAMNESVDRKIAKLRLNLDRIKWLNHRYEPRSIMVNIPDYMLYFVENNNIKKQMRVIVGDKKHRTPIFSNRVSNIVLNPYWNVPDSIIKKEFMPKLLRNPNAMAGQGIEIRRNWDKDAPIISGSSINWKQYRGADAKIPFKFAQPPGAGNALGKIKFLFPNNFAVYMHDTPTKHLFATDVRAYSHGCIRLSEPRELLKIFASFDSAVSLPNANKILKGTIETNLALKNSIPVDIVYLTAWVDYNGNLQFRDDVYGYDAMQLAR